MSDQNIALEPSDELLLRPSRKGQRTKSKKKLAAVQNIANTQQLRDSLSSPLKEQQYFTQTYLGVNQILQYNFKNQKPTFYVPCYLRMRVIKVNDINYVQSVAEIETEIRIWLMINQFPEQVQEQIINTAVLQINSSTKVQFSTIPQPKKLDGSYIKNKSQNAKGFLYSQKMELNIQSDPFLSPYQLVKLTTNLQIKKIVLGEGNQDFKKALKTPENIKRYYEANVQFNFIDAHPFLQFSFGQVRSLGSFDIAQYFVDMKFSNDSIKEQEQQDLQQEDENEQNGLNLVGKVLGFKPVTKQQRYRAGQLTPDAYQHGQILIPLYKYPSTTLINVFVPLYIVGITSLGIFFQDNDMGNRDSGIATFLLAYIAFLPTIRQNLPETPKLVFTQILVYLQITCILICFFYSLYINKVEDYVFIWDETGPFLACVIITLLNICIVIGMFIIHKAFWERKYNKLPKGGAKYIGAKYMNTDDNEEWWNKQCEQQFRLPIQLGLVKPYAPRKVQKKLKPQLLMSNHNAEDSGAAFKTNPNQTTVNKLFDNTKISPQTK